eukprot:5727381-Amphidinium_carterae.1
MALGLTPHTAARVGGGHELEVHEVFTLDGDSCGCLLLCTTCGAYSGARGWNLLRLCMGTPRIHKRSGLLRQRSRAVQDRICAEGQC